MRAGFTLFLAIGLSGCQALSAVRLPRNRNTRAVPWSMAQAWERAVATGERQGYTLVSSDQRRGLLVFEREDPGARVRDYAADAERHFGAMWWRLHITLRVRVQAGSPRQAQVRARADLLAETSLFDPRHGSSGFTTIPLTSGGTLERLYLDEAVLTLPEAPAPDSS